MSDEVLVQHGTLYTYKKHKCRCIECVKAHSDYHNNRHRQIAYGRWQPYVDAAPVRAHVEALQAAGLGWMRIARLARVSTSVVWKLIYGDPGRDMAPSKRVRPETAAKLLAVRPGLEMLGNNAVVDATGTHRRLQALVAIGWSQQQLADRLGMLRSNFGVMLNGQAVRAGTARAVIALYDELWDQAPPQDTKYRKGAVTQAKRYAAARGWAPPAAWDDDSIDDPKARPTGVRTDDSPSGMTREERREAVAIGTRAGLSAKEISDLVGISQRSVVRHRAALAREAAA